MLVYKKYDTMPVLTHIFSYFIHAKVKQDCKKWWYSKNIWKNVHLLFKCIIIASKWTQDPKNTLDGYAMSFNMTLSNSRCKFDAHFLTVTKTDIVLTYIQIWKILYPCARHLVLTIYLFMELFGKYLFWMRFWYSKKMCRKPCTIKKNSYAHCRVI